MRSREDLLRETWGAFLTLDALWCQLDILQIFNRNEVCERF